MYNYFIQLENLLLMDVSQSIIEKWKNYITQQELN